MIKIAVCQIKTTTDWEETMSRAKTMVRDAAANGADFAVFPEMFNCPYSRKYFHMYAEMGHERSLARLSAWAKELGIYIVGGSIPETGDGKIYNSCFIFDREGRQIARHRKVHLFDSQLPGLNICESATFTAGSEITVFDTEFGPMGCAICYDIRFAELFRPMAMRGAKIIFIPSQFNTVSGPGNWEMLVRCRASDQQVFTVGAEAAYSEDVRYRCWGHSVVCGPLGNVIASCDETEQVMYADIDLDEIDRARKSLPIYQSLRRDVYPVAE